jgi:poly-beta-1,6-N-acetyl-D-glucosamine synthase
MVDDPAAVIKMRSLETKARYVLITPVRNEASTIKYTIQSVLSQTHLPSEWIIVNDGSTDNTCEILQRYTETNEIMRIIHLEHGAFNGFASVSHAIEVGYRALSTTDYEYIGLLDADVMFDKSYYEKLIAKFDDDKQLGMGGGIVVDWPASAGTDRYQSKQSVAGATQFFRRNCFESLGGLVGIPEGGWDAITCVQVRMQKYKTKSFVDLQMRHLKPRGTLLGNSIQRSWIMGMRDYSHGNHPLFEMPKCILLLKSNPFILGALVRFLAFLSCYLLAKNRFIPSEVIRYIHKEQLARILRFGKDAAFDIRQKSVK